MDNYDGYEDKLLVCIECGEEFLWRAAERRYFAERQLSEPKRCKPCRAAKKARVQDTMAGFTVTQRLDRHRQRD